MGGLYHLVCRDCAFEGIYTEQDAAEHDRSGHGVEFGHRTVLLDIAERVEE